MAYRVLIVDDDPLLSEGITASLQQDGFSTAVAPDAETALRMLAEANFDVVLTDLVLPEMNGLQLVEEIGRRCPDTFAIVMTAYDTHHTVIKAMRLGAFDYITKPVDFRDVVLRVRRLLEQRDRLTEVKLLKRDLQRAYDFQNIVGRTQKMRDTFEIIRKVAATTSTVLITGESGTGKELIAHAIHYASELTRERRFVAVNCAAISPMLLESELFGHVRGSFTGATAEKRGLFEVAEGGSIFLDEIAEMSLGLQAKLLRAIEEKEVMRVGGTDPIKINVRIICSANKDLQEQVARRRFREDLYYRINVVEVRLPPLRERREDIPYLVQHFVEKYNREMKRAYRGTDNDAMRALMAYEWKGNVRELENVIERAMILGDGKTIRVRDLPLPVAQTSAAPEVVALRDAMRLFERRHLLRVLEMAQGDKVRAAKLLEIGVSSLYRKIEELGLSDAKSVAAPPRAPGGDPQRVPSP